MPQELVDLLQGRISQSVFMKFYYKPLLQDAQQKTIKAILPMQTELLVLAGPKQFFREIRNYNCILDC